MPEPTIFTWCSKSSAIAASSVVSTTATAPASVRCAGISRGHGRASSAYLSDGGAAVHGPPPPRSGGSAMRPESGRGIAGIIRVDCACGAWIVCHAARPFPEACAFCGRALLVPAVATRLHALRVARGLTATMVAARLGVGPRHALVCGLATSAPHPVHLHRDPSHDARSSGGPSSAAARCGAGLAFHHVVDANDHQGSG